MPFSPLVIIPARLAATRLPGKPLTDIHGRPMILHAVDRALEANIGPVAVAAGDPEIVAEVAAAGHPAVLTDPALPSGSDRIHAALSILDPNGRHDIVVNCQVDYPTLDPASVRAALAPLERDPDVDIGTIAAEITRAEERDDPNVVKVFTALDPGSDDDPPIARALAFSRAAVPFGDGPLWHHIGLYAYRRAALERFVSLPPAVLEKRERLEQLRALEDGMRIDVARVAAVPLGVDTPEDLERARDALSGR
jgi:3-deoxy-manno-octulosonate cytidylyltransferase (CMP-KDO synthetase)